MHIHTRLGLIAHAASSVIANQSAYEQDSYTV